MPDLPILGLLLLVALIAAGFAWRLAMFFRMLDATAARRGGGGGR
ncbi:hypothetical protein [Phenylobacterium sp.]